MDNQTRDGSGKGCRRMLFWSGVVFVVVVFSFLGFVAIRLAGMRTSVKREIARIEAAGEPVTYADLIPAPVPEGQNGAVDIEAAIALLPKLSPEDEKFWDYFALPDHPEPTPADIEKARAILAQFREALERTRKGLAKDAFVFDLDYSGITTLSPLSHLKGIRRIARAMCWEARLDCLDGRGDEAARRTLDAVRLARTLEGEPILISQLTSIALYNLAVSQAQYTIEHAKVPAALLRKISSRFAAAPGGMRKGLAWALKGERVMFLAATDEPMQGNAAVSGPQGQPSSASGLRPLRKVFFAANRAFYLPIMRG